MKENKSDLRSDSLLKVCCVDICDAGAQISIFEIDVFFVAHLMVVFLNAELRNRGL